MTDMDDVIEAFADGERVDPEDLDRALADPAGRAHLRDILVLRGFMRSASLVQTPAAANAAPRIGRSFGWLSIAAALTVVASIGAYVAGEHVASSRMSIAAAPAPGPTSTAPVAAPEPTHVIRFEPGVDWTEQKGGH